MATLTAAGSTVRLQLTTAEKIGALRGDLELPRRQIAKVTPVDEPLAAVRGIRAPGLGWPKVVAMGRWRHRKGVDLVVVRRGERGVVVDLTDDAPYRRLVIGVDDPERVAADIRP